MDRGDPIWHTRSTAPMSIPGSSEAVATHTRAPPSFKRRSAARGRSPSQALRRVRQRGVAAGRSRVTPRVLRAVRLVVVRAHQEARHLLDGPLGGGEADAGNRPVGKRA